MLSSATSADQAGHRFELFGLIAAPLVAIAALLSVPVASGPTICPFALATGMACPGCGLTRACASLIRGDVSGALTFHPLVLVVGAWAMGFGVNRLRIRRGHPPLLSERTTNRLITLTGIALIATWGIRIVSGTLPPV